MEGWLEVGGWSNRKSQAQAKASSQANESAFSFLGCVCKRKLISGRVLQGGGGAVECSCCWVGGPAVRFGTPSIFSHKTHSGTDIQRNK